MEGYALAIVGRLETKIGVEGGLQEASHDMSEISMCVDFGDADEGIVVAKFGADCIRRIAFAGRSEEHTSELQSLMRISYAVFCLQKKTHNNQTNKCNKKTHTYKHQHNIRLN